jgi:anti-sigma regulatory factor (Ser/Thr protein kinase)
VLEEAFSNVIFYAFDDKDTHMIGVEFILEKDKLTIVLKDGGKPFDPTAKEDPDTTLSVEERPIGGLGIFLIKKMMDEVYYQRVSDKNHLTMVKYLKDENETTNP